MILLLVTCAAELRAGRRIGTLLIAAGALLLCACDVDRKQTERAVEQIENQVNQLSRSVGDFVANAEAPEELKKLQQFEYRVEALPADLSPSELSERLNVLGRERWECFSAERRPRVSARADAEERREELLLLCKRRPATPLRFIPHTLIGGQ